MTYADKINELMKGFKMALEFAGFYEDETPEECYYSEEAEKAIENLCKAFYTACTHKLGLDLETLPNQYHVDRGSHLVGIGCDLYYTITGCSVGFWDGDYKEYGDTLTEVCQEICYYLELEIGDDNLIYIYYRINKDEGLRGL